MNATRQLLAFLFACMAVAGAASAAQPAARAPVGMTPVAPGLLKGFGAAGKTVVAGQALSFNFEGSGPCKIRLSSGDGYTSDFDGVLPFKAAYTYGTGSMSSFDVSKDYTATVATGGNCKTSGALAPVKVTVMNPAPQSANPPGAPSVQSAATSTVNLKLKP